MKLQKLTLLKNREKKSIIREIFFKEGLNLIVDNTIDGNDKTKTGNNIGKTTLVKIIDLCLGAKTVKSLYYDEDTNSANEIVKEFLDRELVTAELILSNKNGKKIIIEKDLFEGGKSRVNSEVYPQREFCKKLKSEIFDSNEEKPTLRQLIPKFVRVSGFSSEKMLKFLDRSSSTEYEAIYSFLFKLKDEKMISTISILEDKLKKIERKIKILVKDKNLSSLTVLKQKEEFIENELKKYEENKNKVNFLKINKVEIEEIRKIVLEINNIEVEIELLDFEIELIKESVKKLECEKFSENTQVLEEIYKEAKSYVKEIQIKFEELVFFHNSMIENRKQFISQELGEKESRSLELVSIRDSLLDKKEKIHNKIFIDENLDDILEITKQYEGLLIEKGEISTSIKILESVNEEKQTILKEIDNCKDNQEEKKLNIFNDIFSSYSKQLYGERYFIAYNPKWKEEKEFPITCDTVRGQLGTGKKKVVIMAFDLAYLEYSNQENISCPKFVIHDKLENTYTNQLKTIFDISESIDGQLIIPILREKISTLNDELVKTCKIIELSEDDKLFRI